MAQRMTCVRGHQWETSQRPDGTQDVFRVTCPVCGNAGQLSPSSALDEVPPPPTNIKKGFSFAALLVILVAVSGVLAFAYFFRSSDLFGRSSELRDSKTAIVHPGERVHLKWDEPLVETADVTVKSPGNPVNVYLLLLSDVAEAEQKIDKGLPPSPTLASRPWVEDVTVEIKPGKKPFALLLQTNAREANVSVTVKGRRGR